MLTLDDAIRKLVGEGKLGHMTLSALPDGRFQGNHKPRGADGYAVEIKNDPVAALLAALRLPPPEDDLSDLI